MIKWFVSLAEWFWKDLLGAGVLWLEGTLGIAPLGATASAALRAAMIVVPLLVLLEIKARIQNYFHERRIRRSMKGHEVQETGTQPDNPFADQLDAARSPDRVIAQLKKEKRYGRLGDTLAALNRPAEAAKWYLKDGKTLRAAEEMAKAGNTAKAARLLWKGGEYGTAARFYADLGKLAKAAEGFDRAGMTAEAASAHAESGRLDRALDTFTEYFDNTGAPLADQEKMADRCYQMLLDPAYAPKMDPEARRVLLARVGRRFLASGRAALAAQVLRDAGEYQRAAEIFARLGNDTEARRCMAAAARHGEAKG